MTNTQFERIAALLERIAAQLDRNAIACDAQDHAELARALDDALETPDAERMQTQPRGKRRGRK